MKRNCSQWLDPIPTSHKNTAYINLPNHRFFDSGGNISILIVERECHVLNTEEISKLPRLDNSPALLARCYIGRLKTLSSLFYIIFDRLTVMECLEALSNDLGMMNEQIFPPAIRTNETETLLLVKPFDSTFFQFLYSLATTCP